MSLHRTKREPPGELAVRQKVLIIPGRHHDADCIARSDVGSDNLALGSLRRMDDTNLDRHGGERGDGKPVPALDSASRKIYNKDSTSCLNSFISACSPSIRSCCASISASFSSSSSYSA